MSNMELETLRVTLQEHTQANTNLTNERKPQSEGHTSSTTTMSQENTTDNSPETDDVAKDTPIPDTEASCFLTSPRETTTLADGCFKEPQIISAIKNTDNICQISDIENVQSPLVTDSEQMPADLQRSSSADVVDGELNINEKPPTPPYSQDLLILKSGLTNEDDSQTDLQSINSNFSNFSERISERKRVNLYAPDTGPQFYQVKGNLVTRAIITSNLPKVYQYLPVTGKPKPNMPLQEFYQKKVRAYIGFDLNDEEFEDLENYCSPELLKTGKEIKMQTSIPVLGLLKSNIRHNNLSVAEESSDPPNLVTLKKYKRRVEKDTTGIFTKKLKYRSVRLLPSHQTDSHNADEPASTPSSNTETEEELEPGVDILYRVRIYRPYAYNIAKDRYTRSRHSVFCCDVVAAGRQALAALRDRFVCHNDFDLRVDVSAHPDMLPPAKAKEVFPSGFLFINNVFYVDTREGCSDYSAPIRDWARRRHLGAFPRRDLCAVRLHELTIKLGYPEVYVHQGNCEHVFVFSDVYLAGAGDPRRLSLYPHATAIAQNQTVYCTTCAEFSAKWIVVGSDRVPFDPGFFCDTCFKQYMYKDGQKIGNFKAYRYRGNALNILKPI